jgi:hypothetical protein
MLELLGLDSFGDFIDSRVNEKTEPASLEEMKDQTFFTIEKTEPQKVAVTKVQERTQEQRTTSVQPPQPAFPLNGVPERRRVDGIGCMRYG